ncbi:MAG: hypothetical protein CMB64_04905 [Euryarchaeota archaeon]|nr:hypothetical protein [Euryarchaeota archaeon]
MEVEDENDKENDKKPEKRKIENLTFSGGGMKGICFLGCIKALYEFDMLSELKATSGSSVGSLVAALLACKCDYEYLSKCVHSTMNLYSNYTIPKGIFKALRRMNSVDYGLFQTSEIHEHLKSCLKNALSDDEEITFAYLYNKTKIKLIVTATCLDDKTPFYFNHETTPNTTVAEACMISCNIPLIFEKKNILNKNMTDGAIVELLPMQCWPETELENTLAFLLVKNKKTKQYNSIMEYIDDLIAINTSYQVEQYKKKYFDSICIVTPPQTINAIPTATSMPTKEEISAIIYSSFFQTLSTLEEKNFKTKTLPENYIYENELSLPAYEDSDWLKNINTYLIILACILITYKIYKRRS